MKFIPLLFLTFLFTFQMSAQEVPKEIILNIKNNLPANWVSILSSKGTWKLEKEVAVIRKKIKPNYLQEFGKEWTFQKSKVMVSPYYAKMNEEEYTNLEVTYYQQNRVLILNYTMTNAGKTFEQMMLYEVINLTPNYLILDRIDNSYCYDLSTGRKLSKKECKEKRKQEPKRMFGGSSITIGFGKKAKRRLIFRLKN